MRGVPAFVLAALAVCSVGAQDTRETQPSASTQVEEIYVVRSVPESTTAPTEFCAEERIGFAGATGEGHFTLGSTVTQASDGRMIDTNVKAIGSIRMCNGPTADPSVFNFYGEGFLGSTPFRGVGECYGGKRDFPERGIGTTSCFLHLSGLPSQYVGGLLTTNTMWSRKGRGIDTDPPGYTEASIATIRLWRKRDAPSSAIPLTKESLVGTWELVSFKETNEKGEVRDAYGPNPVGFLTYTADDRVSVIMADSRRKPLSIPPPFPIEERAEAFSTFAAYAGTYTLTGDKVIHHIEVAWAQNLVNTEQVRSVTLQGDRLTLRGGLAVKGVTYDAGSELVWERMKPQATGK